MTFIALALGWVAFLLLILVFILAQKAEKYKRAFRDTATKLYNVTGERDALVIQKVGLEAALIRAREEMEYKQSLGRAQRAFTTLKPEDRE